MKLSWCNSQFFCLQSSWRSLSVFSRSPLNITVVCGIDRLACQGALWTIPLVSQKIMSMLLTLLFTCLTFFGLPRTEHAIQTPVYGSPFLPRTPISSLPGSPSHFFRDLRKIWCWSSSMTITRFGLCWIMDSCVWYDRLFTGLPRFLFPRAPLQSPFQCVCVYVYIHWHMNGFPFWCEIGMSAVYGGAALCSPSSHLLPIHWHVVCAPTTFYVSKTRQYARGTLHRVVHFIVYELIYKYN
jgi:hypothetical protein